MDSGYNFDEKYFAQQNINALSSNFLKVHKIILIYTQNCVSGYVRLGLYDTGTVQNWDCAGPRLRETGTARDWDCIGLALRETGIARD